MDIKRRILEEKIDVVCDENDIQQVIRHSKAAFIKREGERILPYHEFLLRQLQITQKRWWALQLLLLLAAWYMLGGDVDSLYIKRGLGIIAAAFVILIVPELWKNLSNRCLEIEMGSYYSLQRIYSARLLLFGGADLILLTFFSAYAHTMLRVSLMEFITAFLLPLVITAAICFLLLGSRHQSIGLVVGACFGWSALWWILISNEKLYNMVTMQAWIGIFAAACVFLGFTIYRVFVNCNKLWEVNTSGTIFEQS